MHNEILKKIAIGIEYNGEPFSGWQTQPNQKLTVQSTIETSLSKIAGEQISVICAGRTDRGVHALNQVVHFKCQNNRPLSAWTLGVNTYLPKTISILWAKVVKDDFHARFSATYRKYCYVILNRKIRPAIFDHCVTWIYEQLDENLMRQAAEVLIGTHDFSSFRSSCCQARSPIRTMIDVKIHRKQEFIFIEMTANAFLHKMVRNIVGVLIQIGLKKIQPFMLCEILEAKNRSKACNTASPNGLYLIEIGYPNSYEIPLINYSLETVFPFFSR